VNRLAADYRYDIEGTSVRKPEPAYGNQDGEIAVLREIRLRRQSKMIKFRLVVLSIIFFSICVTVAYRYALITEQAFTINSLNKQHDELANQNVKIEADITKNLDLNKIRQLAETTLAMQKPAKNQIVYVPVPKNDYATAVSSEKFAFLTNIKARFSVLLGKPY
jgi:cell division protein FtsB